MKKDNYETLCQLLNKKHGPMWKEILLNLCKISKLYPWDIFKTYLTVI